MTAPERAELVRRRKEGMFYVYELDDTELPYGPSFGNNKCWVTVKAPGVIQEVFSIDLGETVLGSVTVKYADPTHLLVAPKEKSERTGAALVKVGVGKHLIHPAYHRHTFRIMGGIEVEETIFVPNTTAIDPPLAYHVVRLKNLSEESRRVSVYAYAHLRGKTEPDIEALFDQRLNALVAWNRSRPNWTRVFGCTKRPARFATTHDIGSAYDPLNILPLPNDSSAKGDVLGALQVDLTLQPGAAERFAFIVAFSTNGPKGAKEIYEAALNFEDALENTIAFYESALSRAEVLTPDRIINEGVQWAKANMVKVKANYPKGPAFTNNPGKSSHVVVRDVVWFIYGSDYVDPDFSEAMLRSIAKHAQHPSGKIMEYFDARTGEAEDYGLNINDATPLFILGVEHHFAATGNEKFLKDLYPAVERAAEYILSQRDERGLVICTATGMGERGIASWRNVIPGERINGAVTEINAECYAALLAASRMASFLGRPPEVVDRFHREAERLKAAMNKHLLDKRTSMYYLNIDLEGNARTEVTGDEVFPIMFGVADRETAFRIVSRLSWPDFWTEAGLRTLSRHSPNYTPDDNVGLTGGVWPGLTFWYAFAAAKYHPEFMAEALRISYRSYIRNPMRCNTVPGQFSEWFDGESLVNRGMRLSPWEPPRYLWAAVEGACGIELPKGGEPLLRVNPRLPPSWKWIAIRHCIVRGAPLSFFCVRHRKFLRLYANRNIDTTTAAKEVYQRDVTPAVSGAEEAAILAFLGRRGKIAVCIGNVLPRAVVVPLDLSGLLQPEGVYRVDMLDTERDDWLEVGEVKGKEISSLSVRIEGGGARVIEIEPTFG
ncbi:MAG TPA: hypothetical protein EYP65_06375 [Armatimonadetes bacterium]|nr:hypothetical protein [Armatimonadota bacterium]